MMKEEIFHIRRSLFIANIFFPLTHMHKMSMSTSRVERETVVIHTYF